MVLTLQQVRVAPLWAASWLPAVGQLWLKHLSELCGVPLESEPQSWVGGGPLPSVYIVYIIWSLVNNCVVYILCIHTPESSGEHT